MAVGIGPIALTTGGAAGQVVTANGTFTASGQPRPPAPIKGLIVHCKVLAFTGGASPTVTFTVNEVDAFGNVVAVLATAALNVASGEIVLTIFEGAPVTANISANRSIGANYTITTTIAGAPTNATIQLGVEELI